MPVSPAPEPHKNREEYCYTSTNGQPHHGPKKGTSIVICSMKMNQIWSSTLSGPPRRQGSASPCLSSSDPHVPGSLSQPEPTASLHLGTGALGQVAPHLQLVATSWRGGPPRPQTSSSAHFSVPAWPPPVRLGSKHRGLALVSNITKQQPSRLQGSLSCA